MNISHANNTKEYIHLSSCITRELIYSCSLTPKAVCLWFLLYDITKMHKMRTITVSKAYLASQINRSHMSVMRYSKELRDNGFLEYQEQGGSSMKTGRPNTYTVTIPKELQERLEVTKNRRNVKTFGTGSDYLNNYQAYEEYATLNPTPSEYQEQPKNKPNADQILPGCNTFVTLYTNNILSNNSNREVETKVDQKVCSVDFSNKEIEDKEITIDSINEHMGEMQVDMKKAKDEFIEISKDKNKDVNEIFKKMKEYHLYQSDIHQLEGKVDFLMNDIKRIKEEERATQEIKLNINHVNDIPGARRLSKPMMTYLLNRVTDVFGGDCLNALIINQIVYSIRFGELVNFKRTKDIMPIQRSINIAIKLLREGRWVEPLTMKDGMRRKYGA